MTKEQTNQSSKKETGIDHTPVILNRKERRSLQRETRRAQNTLDKTEDSGVTILSSAEDLIDNSETDIGVLKSQLSEYKLAHSRLKLQLKLTRIYKLIGLSESTIQGFFYPERDKKSAIANAHIEIKPDIHLKYHGQLAAINKEIKRLGKQWDEEEVLAVRTLEKLNVPTEDLIKEVIRSRASTIELIQMQLQYLVDKESEKRRRNITRAKELGNLEKEIYATQRAEKEKDIKSQEEIEEELIPAHEEEIFDEPFHLEGWDILWTTKYWSANPNHFKKVPTDSRENTLVAITELGRGHISIKPSSVLNALEFHLLSKDHIQKALSTRLKYGPGEQVDWIKIKRGRDRIGLLIDEEQPKRVIFFVGGRDEVYSGLN